MGMLKKIEKVNNENGIQDRAGETGGQHEARGGRLVRVGTRSAPGFIDTAPVRAGRQEAEPGQTVRGGSFGGSTGGRRYTQGFAGGREPTLWQRAQAAAEGAVSGYMGDMLSALGTGVQQSMANQDLVSPLIPMTEPGSGMRSFLEEAQKGQRPNELGQGIRAAGREFSSYGEQSLERAKAGLGKGGQAVVDIAAAGGQMGLDILVGGGKMIVPMVIRVFGGAAEEAAQDGADLTEQVRYGLASGAVSYATEHISNIALSGLKVVAPGVADDVLRAGIDKLTRKLAGTPKGGTALKALASLAAATAGEGFEEFLEAYLNPYIKRLTYDKSAADIFSDPELLSQALYDALIGGTLGLAGGGVDLAVNTALGGESDGNLREVYRQYQQEFTDSAMNAAYDAVLQKGMFSQEGKMALANARKRIGTYAPELSRPTGKALGRLSAAEDARIPTETETPATGRETAHGGAIRADTSLFDKGLLRDFNKARRYMIEFAKQHFPQTVTNLETGKQIGISRTGLDKFLSGNIPYEKYASGFHIPELIERGHKVNEADNYHPETAESIPTFEYYDSPIEIDGQTYNAHIRVKNTLVGDKYYGHTVSEVEDIKIEPPTRASSPENPAVQSEKTGGSENIIARRAEAVNKKAPPATVDETGMSPDHTSETGGRPALSDTTLPQQAGAVNGWAEPGYHGGATAGIMTVYEATMLDRLGKAAGVAIQAAPPTGDGRQGWYQNGRVYIAEDAQDPVLVVARHEITHRLQETAPEQYLAFRDYAAQVMESRGGLREQIDAITELYARNNQELTEEEALDELAADLAGELLTDEAAIRRLAGEDRTLGQRIRDAIHDLLRRIRAVLGGEEARTLERAARLWDQALEASQGSQSAGDGGTRYSIAPGFEEEVDRWDGVTDTYFRLGTTSDALRSIGLEEKEIVMRSAKAAEILHKHAGMSREIIKQIPNILEDPVLVLNSRSASQENGGKSSRIVAFGQVYDADGAPVTAVLELRPTLGGGEVQDYQLLVSAYGKNKNLRQMVEESQALYLGPDKNRTDTWLHGLGLQSPSYETKYGPVGTVSYADGYVNIQGVPWKNIAQTHRVLTQDGKVLNIQEKEFTQKETDAAIAENPSPGTNRSTASISGDSIPQGGGAVNGEVSEDGRYSVKGAKDLQKQVELLQRQNARLKEQMKRTGIPKANHQAVARQAREILSAYSSKYDQGKLTDRMESLYTDMAARGGSIYEQDYAPSWEELRQSARKLAEDILAESWENVNSLTAEYRDFQRELRGRAIALSPQYRADLESVGGYEAFRKRYFGRLKLVNHGTPVETVYQELAERWPELLPDDIVYQADQLIRMADMLDAIAPVMGNAYEADMDRTAEYLAGDILERFYDTPQENPTFADRKARQRAEQRLKDRETFQDRLNRQRFASDKKLKELKEEHRRQNRERIERQNASQRRETIRRHADRLGKMLLRPTDKRHVPEPVRNTALAFVRLLNTESGYEYEYRTDAMYHRVKRGTVLGTEGNPTTRTEAARALQAAYAELSGNGALTVDPDMAGYLDEIAKMGNKRVADMSREELDTVWKVLRVIEHTATQADELLQESKFRTVSDMARALREENGGREDRRDYARVRGALDKLLNLDMLTPETFLHRMGSAGEDLYRQMRLADDQKTQILKEATDRGRELIKGSGVDFSKADRELHTFQLEDGELTLSTSQIMELYALSHRQQAMEHIYTGGLLSRGNTGKLGVKLENSRSVKVSPMDVADILNTLTPEQKALMDDLQSYLSRELAEHGNRASLAVYGYEKFKEDNYWPIRVSREQVKSDPAQKAAAKTISGFGMTKALTEHANNAVELRSAADTFSDHVTQMATYAAWLGTSENVTRLMNHTYTTDGGGWRAGEGRSRDGTVKELLRKVYGEGGQAYLEKLLGDVAGGTKAVRDTNFSMGNMTSAFKASAVGGNLRVILQQPTAILRAAEMMDPKYLLAGMARRGGWKKALEHSPIAQWKDWGYFEMDTGKSVREIMLGAEGALNKAQSAMMAPAGWADGIAWGALWNAVEAETRAEHKDLGENTQAFYDRCNERFSEIIDRTQVVDTVLHRSQAMRSQNELYKMATSFMSEPTKIYNEIARGVYDFTQAENKADRVKAAHGLGRKALALTLSFAVNAVAQSLPDAWRDKDREKNYWGRFGENWAENFLDNYIPIGYIPFLKDGLSVFQGYDVARMDMEVFSDIVSSAMQVQKAAVGEGKATLGYASLDLALQACRALGLPLANIKRDVVGILSNGFLDLGLYEQAYELDKLMYREEGDQGRFAADLYRAMNGDDADYRAIYRDLEATLEALYPGEGGEKLKAAMERLMKRDLGVTRSTSLPVRYSAPGENPEFDRLVREGQSGGGWWSALPEGAAELAGSLDAMEDAKTLDRLVTIGDSPWSETVKEDAMEASLTGKGLERYRAARQAGVSTYAYTDFLDRAYRAARKRTGKDSASPSQEDVEKALESARITDRQRTAIWDSYGWKRESPWG